MYLVFVGTIFLFIAMIEIQPRRSLLGIPPSVAFELYNQGIDPTPYLSVRGRAALKALIKRDSLKPVNCVDGGVESDSPRPVGCVETVLGLPGLKQIREALPVGFKERVKGIVRIAIGDKIEP